MKPGTSGFFNRHESRKLCVLINACSSLREAFLLSIDLPPFLSRALIAMLKSPPKTRLSRLKGL